MSTYAISAADATTLTQCHSGAIFGGYELVAEQVLRWFDYHELTLIVLRALDGQLVGFEYRCGRTIDHENLYPWDRGTDTVDLRPVVGREVVTVEYEYREDAR